MEFCMGLERALKSSLRREFSMKSTHQQAVLFDDLSWCAGGVSCDDFFVDDLLDFSNGEFEELEFKKDSLSVYSQDRVDVDNNSNSSSFSSDQSVITDELVEPVDEIAELEWVSRFVDDSSRSELSLMYPNYGEYRFEPELKPVLNQTPCFPLSFPSKARTKRTRPAPISRFWPLGSSSYTESPISSSSSSGSTITSTVQNMESYYSFTETEPEAKRPKKKPAVQNGGLLQRRCTHCQTQKTPQWRTGPVGPKTLCNACGVRYKSGRLFPEYRPACSPTFSGDVHSNSHRKVLEMRKKKEMAGPEVGLSHMVPSF